MKKPFTESLKWWGKYLQNTLFFWLYEPKPKEIDKSWVGIKLSHSVYPQGFPKDNPENVYKYLEKEWEGKVCIKKKIIKLCVYLQNNTKLKKN